MDVPDADKVPQDRQTSRERLIEDQLADFLASADVVQFAKHRRQALDDRNTANAKEALERIVEALNRATETLRKARD